MKREWFVERARPEEERPETEELARLLSEITEREVAITVAARVEGVLFHVSELALKQVEEVGSFKCIVGLAGDIVPASLEIVLVRNRITLREFVDAVWEVPELDQVPAAEIEDLVDTAARLAAKSDVLNIDLYRFPCEFLEEPSRDYYQEMVSLYRLMTAREELVALGGVEGLRDAHRQMREQFRHAKA